MKTDKETLTFEEEVKQFILDCKARGLREATIKHYTEAYQQIKKYINPQTNLNKIDGS